MVRPRGVTAPTAGASPYVRWVTPHESAASSGLVRLTHPTASGRSSAQSGAVFGSFLGPLAHAGEALATERLDEGVHVVAAVMVGDFVFRLDVLDGADFDRMLDEINL